jgi:fatty acid desaturase (delta-4 desaturase)
MFHSDYLGKVDQSFLRKQVLSGSNVGGAWLCFLNGGLNYQIEHHLFPRIAHAHYPTIAPLVRQYCLSKGIPYVHFPTIQENVASCARHMYQLGRSGGVPTNYVNASGRKEM